MCVSKWIIYTQFWLKIQQVLENAYLEKKNGLISIVVVIFCYDWKQQNPGN